MTQPRPAGSQPNEIAGRYVIVQKLGAGAFGTVYKARDKMLGRMVAIKTIRLEGLAASSATLDDLQKRFQQEARAGAALKHPNIATVYDIGEAEGVSYLAMEFIDGVGLERIIAEGRVPVERAAGLAAQVADALGYAHEHGVIHRDIKPANVMVEAGERVKVTDFGIAKVAGAAEHLTQTGSLLGTPSYMSPEQARGEKVDGRSDLFSVGCVLYELLAGRKAFRGDSITSLIFKIITDEPEPLQQVDPEIPDEAARIVAKALLKNPEARYQTGRELAADLLALAHPGHVPTLRQSDAPTAPIATPDMPTVATPPTSRPATTVVRERPSAGAATTPVPPTRLMREPGLAPPPPAPRAPRATGRSGGRPASRGGRGLVLGLGAAGVLVVLIAAGLFFYIAHRRVSSERTVPTSAGAESTPLVGDHASTLPPPGAEEGSEGAANAPAPDIENAPQVESTPPQAESTPTPAVLARAATPPPPTARATPGATSPAAASRPEPVSPPLQAPPATTSEAFLDELPEQPDGRAAADALAQQYRSGDRSTSGFGSNTRFRRRPRIPPHTPAERPAVRALAWILSAQNAHHRRTGSYGTLSDLVNSRELPLDGAWNDEGFVRREYRFTVEARGDTFRADARPLTPRGRAFYVDEDGFVLVAE